MTVTTDSMKSLTHGLNRNLLKYVRKGMQLYALVYASEHLYCSRPYYQVVRLHDRLTMTLEA